MHRYTDFRISITDCTLHSFYGRIAIGTRIHRAQYSYIEYIHIEVIKIDFISSNIPFLPFVVNKSISLSLNLFVFLTSHILRREEWNIVSGGNEQRNKLKLRVKLEKCWMVGWIEYACTLDAINFENIFSSTYFRIERGFFVCSNPILRCKTKQSKIQKRSFISKANALYIKRNVESDKFIPKQKNNIMKKCRLFFQKNFHGPIFKYY